MIKQVDHPVQIAILRELLSRPSQRFAGLQAGSGLTSDHFTFHINKLVDARLIRKQPAGAYELTAKGKEYANRLPKDEQVFSRQPKLSVLLSVERNQNGRREFLIQRRLKHPHYGFYGRISGKVRWEEPLTETAARILHDETGLIARFSFVALLRKYDYDQDASTLLEDKIFAVMQAQEPTGELIKKWTSGQNIWMTSDEFMQLDPSICFKSARAFMSSPDSNALYFEESNRYKDSQY